MTAPPHIALRVGEVAALAPTLKRFRLEAADGGVLPASGAGAHVVLDLKGADRRWRNAYSIVSAPGERQAYEIIVRRVQHSRGGSAYLHEAVGKGAVIEAAPPHNLFPLDLTARKHVLIGGGVGLTPLMSHLAALRSMGAAFELHQVCRPEEATVFQRLLSGFAGSEVYIHAARDACDLRGVLAPQPLGSRLYVCGPASLMDAVHDAAARLGWPRTAVRHESFGDHREGAPFLAVLARSGLEIRVGEQESLLEAIEGAGGDAAYLCRGGACGECVTRVIDGEPEHRDDVLSPEERAAGDRLMICVSRSKTPRLVLDL